MADNKPYTVMIGNVEHTLMLSSEEAKRYGDLAKPVAETKAKTPQNKASRPTEDRSKKSSRKVDHSDSEE